MRLIVSDLIPDSLRASITRIKPDIQTTVVTDFEHAVQCVEQLPDVDLVMLDAGMPGIDGSHGLDVMRERFPGLPVVLVSDHADAAQVRDALRGGASGFIPVDLNAEAMLMALELVLSSGIYLPANLLLDHGRLPLGPRVGQA